MATDQSTIISNNRVGVIQAEPVLNHTNLQTSSSKRVFMESIDSPTGAASNDLCLREAKRQQTSIDDASSVSPSGVHHTNYNQFNSSSSKSGGRLDDNEGGGKSVVVRNIPNDATAADVAFLFSPFSSQAVNVSFISQGEALVELENSTTAERAVQYLNAYRVAIRGVAITAMHANAADRTGAAGVAAVEAAGAESELYGSMGGQRERGESSSSSLRVLLVTIRDVRYAVDIELLHRLFCVYGQVEKIITFSKASNRHQALIQYANPRSVKGAFNNLNDKCIFDGCNKIQIQTSKLTQLIVKENNDKSWDFTVAAFPFKQRVSDATPRSAAPPVVSYNGVSSTGGGGGGGAGYGSVGALPTAPHHQASYGAAVATGISSYSTTHQQPSSFSSAAAATNQQQVAMNPDWLEKLPREIQQNPDILHRLNPMQSCVVICYNLPIDEDMTVMVKLFNLLSLYGVVLRMKFLRDKPDTALAQFSHPLFASLACYYLTNAPLFGGQTSELQISISKKSEVKLPRTDGMGSETPEAAAKRTVAFQPRDQRARADEVEKFLRSACKPTNTLFIANVHESVDERTLRELLSPIGTVTKVEFASSQQQSQRLTATVEMASEKLALTALCNLHNHRLAGLHLKIAFSKRILKDKNN